MNKYLYTMCLMFSVNIVAMEEPLSADQELKALRWQSLVKSKKLRDFYLIGSIEGYYVVKLAGEKQLPEPAIERIFHYCNIKGMRNKNIRRWNERYDRAMLNGGLECFQSIGLFTLGCALSRYENIKVKIFGGALAAAAGGYSYVSLNSASNSAWLKNDPVNVRTLSYFMGGSLGTSYLFSCEYGPRVATFIVGAAALCNLTR